MTTPAIYRALGNIVASTAVPISILSVPPDGPAHPQPPALRQTNSLQWNAVVPFERAADWQKRAIRSLTSLRKLGANWDGYGSPPLRESALQWGADLIWSIPYEIRPPGFAPESGGAVQIDFRGDDGRELELHVQQNGSVEFLKIENGKSIEEGEFSQRDVSRALSLITWLTRSDA